MPVTSTARRNHSLATVAAAVIVGVVVGIGVLLVPGASKDRGRADAPATRPAAQPMREVTFRQRQRTTKALPGVEGPVTLGIGDVTGGKVKLVVTDAEGRNVVEGAAVREGDVVNVPLGERKLLLMVKDLRNALIGEDEVVFVLSEAGAPKTMTEEEKIERLIVAVKELPGAVFIRNGGEHSAGDATEHMRRKWERGKKEIATARDFIAKAGSRSSLSGEAYRIRYADGKEVTAEEFLTKKLGEIEGAGAATTRAVEASK